MQLQLFGIEKMNSIILVDNPKLTLLNNDNCLSAKFLFFKLSKLINLTYLTYLYEDFSKNEKFFYTSNCEWQNLLINEKLINCCPVYQAAFTYLAHIKDGNIIIPWVNAPPKNKNQKDVCGMRNEFNISNGIGYGFQHKGIRESIAFAGNLQDINFYNYFIQNKRVVFLYLSIMRNIFITNNSQNLITPETIH